MGKSFDSLSDRLRDWALSQQVFFTASAPINGKHVNVSPKGRLSSTFTIFDPNHAAYVDATGSGCETISHLYENGRITIMFCSFESTPRILRLFCIGKVVEWDHRSEFEALAKRMNKAPIEGARAIILLDIFEVKTSCGYGVPLLELADDGQPCLHERSTLASHCHRLVAGNKIRQYQEQWNLESMDGLPGLKMAQRYHDRATSKPWPILFVDAVVGAMAKQGATFLRKDYIVVALMSSLFALLIMRLGRDVASVIF